MQSLVRFAEAVNCAVLCLTHVSKGASRKSPLERVTGALAYGAVPRVVLIAAKINGNMDDGLERGVVVNAKVTNAGMNGGLEYRIEPVELPIDGTLISTTRIEWSPELLEGSADEILKAATSEDEGKAGRAVGLAMEFLQNKLAGGPMLCVDVKAQASEAGISPRTLVRARKELGIQSAKGPNGQSVLSLVNMPVSVLSPGNAISGWPSGGTMTPAGRWSHGYPPGYPPYGSSLNGTPSPFTNGQQVGAPPTVPGGVPYGDVFTSPFPHLATAQRGMEMATGAERRFVQSSDHVGTVGTVGTVGPVEQPKSGQGDDKPSWVSDQNWHWLRQGYQKEYGETKRFDFEDEPDFQARVGELFLDASCPDWDRKDELCRALVATFNRLPYVDNLGAAF